jgi:hypothetical protein
MRRRAERRRGEGRCKTPWPSCALRRGRICVLEKKDIYNISLQLLIDTKQFLYPAQSRQTCCFSLLFFCTFFLHRSFKSLPVITGKLLNGTTERLKKDLYFIQVSIDSDISEWTLTKCPLSITQWTLK